MFLSLIHISEPTRQAVAASAHPPAAAAAAVSTTEPPTAPLAATQPRVRGYYDLPSYEEYCAIVTGTPLSLRDHHMSTVADFHNMVPQWWQPAAVSAGGPSGPEQAVGADRPAAASASLEQSEDELPDYGGSSSEDEVAPVGLEGASHVTGSQP